GIVITMNPFARLLWCVSASRSNGERTSAVHEAREQQSRPKPAPLCHCVTNRLDELQFISAIAYRGHASGEIYRPPLDLFEVRVHIPQPRQEIFPFPIDNAGLFWNLHLSARSPRLDAAFLDYNRRVGNRSRASAIDQRRANDCQR